MKKYRLVAMGVCALLGASSLLNCSDDAATKTDAGATTPEASTPVDAATSTPDTSTPPPDASPDTAVPFVTRKLDPSLAWHGTNRDRLDAMMAAKGKGSPGYDAAKKPVATFDWDNTVMKNDVGDATFFWMLKNNKVLQPTAGNWALTSPYLTVAATAALGTACPRSLAAAGAALPTSTNDACAKELLSVYVDAKTTGGAAAFAGWNYRRIEPAYAWLAQLMAGYTFAETKAFAESALVENIANPKGTNQTIGTVSVTHWVRVYDQMKDLIGALQANGFDVWIISASPQSAVEAAATRVNVAADHVVGIRNLVVGGKLTANLAGCGDVPDGTNDGSGTFTGNSMITYIDGKRCWANKVIYGDNGASALTKTADLAKRQVFAAGDSDTDITFVQDATTLKLVLNRNKKELMCNAYGNADGKWLVNPMFIDPKAQQTAPYPCATTGCKDAAGASVPCLDENGKAIPDQTDTVF